MFVRSDFCHLQILCFTASTYTHLQVFPGGGGGSFSNIWPEVNWLGSLGAQLVIRATTSTSCGCKYIYIFEIQTLLLQISASALDSLI